MGKYTYKEAAVILTYLRILEHKYIQCINALLSKIDEDKPTTKRMLVECRARFRYMYKCADEAAKKNCVDTSCDNKKDKIETEE